MRIRDPETDQEEPVNLMPLIDMVFLLLIFFLVATTFRQEEREINIQLPGLFSSQPLSSLPQQLIINIREDGSVVITGKTYDRKELEEMLGTVATYDPNREVLIRADERSLHRYFAEVAAIVRRCGISEVKIGYVPNEYKPEP